MPDFPRASGPEESWFEPRRATWQPALLRRRRAGPDGSSPLSCDPHLSERLTCGPVLTAVEFIVDSRRRSLLITASNGGGSAKNIDRMLM